MNPTCGFLLIRSAIVFSLLCASLPAWAQTAPSRAATIIDAMPVAKVFDQAAISPDGNHVAYIVEGHLSIIPSAGVTSRPIAVEGQLLLRDVAWSPDSKQIAFLADLLGDVPSAQLWTSAADGSAPV